MKTSRLKSSKNAKLKNKLMSASVFNRSSGGEGGIHKSRNISLNKETSGMFNGRLKSLRKSRKLSQKDFAQALRVSQQTVASWESGRTEPSNTALRDIADYFNVSADYLFGCETPKSPALSAEQTIVLKGFDSLNLAGRNLLVGVLDSLRVSHSAAV
ncbi:MAG: helix-turn-helix transcriptional regulator [Selenomonadaceae bacterium]|nr:helix-turn-helix transcriptional regulator [Selenomonadaceae bacterium]